MHWLLINATYQFWSWHSSKHNSPKSRNHSGTTPRMERSHTRRSRYSYVERKSLSHFVYQFSHLLQTFMYIYIYIFLEFVIYPSFFTMNIIWWEILFLQITIFYPFLKRIFTKRIKTFKFLFIFLLYMINIKNTWNMM